jgi:peptidoglycan/LPS O-acetylase OafA/YrhL
MNTRSYFPQLTGLRAIAALLVFIHHFAFAEEKAGRFLYRFQSELYIGVSIFFVLSGFLITLRYYDERISLKQYAINRFARIYPMFFLLTVLTFVYYYLNPGEKFASEAMGKDPVVSFLANITLLRGFFDELKFTGIAQGWTLTVEECFYFLAPVIFILLRRKIKPLFIVVAFYLVGSILVLLPKGNNVYGFFNSWQFMFIVTFFGRCLDFFVGIQLALWFKQKNEIPSKRKTYFTWVGLVLMIVTILLLMIPGLDEARYPVGLYTTAGLIINNWILPFAIGVLFWGLITERTWVTKILSTKLFDLLGKSSYTFYLVHMGVISLLVVDLVPIWIIHLPIMLMISIILYKLVEEPMNKWVRTFSGKNSASKRKAL